MPTYDPLLPIAWLMNTINLGAAAALNTVAGRMIAAIAPLAAACLGIYIILMMWNYLRGAEADPLMDFLLKMTSWSVVIGYGLNADTYTTTILPLVTGLGSELTGVITGGAVSQHSLDVMALNYIGIIGNGVSALSSLGWGEIAYEIVPLLLKSILIIVGVLPFLVVAISFIVLANIGVQIVAAVGPLFFLALLFPATRQYFSSWLNTAFSYALLPAFISVITLLATSVSMQIMGLVDDGAGTPVTLIDVSFFSVFIASIANTVFIFLLKQAASIASSLSSGGINAGMASAGGALAGGAKSATSGQVGKGAERVGQGAAAAWSKLTTKGNSITKGG